MSDLIINRRFMTTLRSTMRIIRLDASIAGSLRGFYLMNQFILMRRARRMHRQTRHLVYQSLVIQIYLRQLDNIPSREEGNPLHRFALSDESSKPSRKCDNSVT